MKKILLVFTALVMIVTSCNKQASNQLATEQSKKGKGHNQTTESVLGTAAAITLTNNNNGTFSIDYGGATDVVWIFFRTGDSLYSNGNVYPTNSQSYYLNPVTTFPVWISGAYYQAVVVTGSTAPDANGVVGTDWVFNYSNVVQ